MKQIFESDRIIFVEVSEELAQDYLVLVNDFERVERFIGGRHRTFTLENEYAWVKEKLEEKAPVFSMIEKESGDFIGNIELMDPSETEAELGIAIIGDKQDKGFGTEAVMALSDYAAQKLGLPRLFLRTNLENARAAHVYQKCGFREYKRNEEHIFMVKVLLPIKGDQMDYKTLFALFDSKAPNIDETVFYFRTDPKEREHYIGCIREEKKPYWIGLCDIEGGCNFETAKELFEAPVFDGRSLKDRWDEVVLVEMSGINIDEWAEII